MQVGVGYDAAVHELDKATEFSLGSVLRVSEKYKYSDLDELIVSHVKQMSLKINEMMSNDKFKGTPADLSQSPTSPAPSPSLSRHIASASEMLTPLVVSLFSSLSAESDHGEPGRVGLWLRARDGPHEGRPADRRLPQRPERADPEMGQCQVS